MRYRILISACVGAISCSIPSIAHCEDRWQSSANYRIASQTERTQQSARNWEHAYLALSAIDLAQTLNCLDKHTCTEGNPIWGKRPKAATLIAAKVAGGAFHYAAFTYANRRNPKMALRFAQISVFGQAGVVGLNARLLF